MEQIDSGVLKSISMKLKLRPIVAPTTAGPEIKSAGLLKGIVVGIDTIALPVTILLGWPIEKDIGE